MPEGSDCTSDLKKKKKSAKAEKLNEQGERECSAAVQVGVVLSSVE